MHDMEPSKNASESAEIQSKKTFAEFPVKLV